MNRISSDVIKYSFIILCLAFLFVLGADAYFSFNEMALCPTQGCKIADSYVIGGGKLFPLFGVGFSIIVLVLFSLFSSKKRSSIFEYILWIMLLCALSFDGVLIGYLTKMHIFCILCLAVALSLLLFMTLFSLYTKRYYIILLGICIWISSFLGINFLKTGPMGPPDIEKGVMFHLPSRQKTATNIDLFVSLHCFHCFDVVFNLAKAMPYNNVNWNIHFLDMSHNDMLKIAHMLKDKDIKKNPFGVILKYEEMKKLQEIKIPDFIKDRLKKSRNYFRYMGFHGVPLLIMRTPDVESIVIGDKSIGRFLLKQGIVKKWYILSLVR